MALREQEYSREQVSTSAEMLHQNQVEQLMQVALREAEAGMTNGEIPIGAVVAVESPKGFDVLAASHNRNIETSRRIAHAELLAIDAASNELVRRADPGTLTSLNAPLDSGTVVLVSTIEPCIMCFSAAIISGISNVVFGLPSPADAGPRRVQMIDKAHARFPTVSGGVLARQSRQLFENWLTMNAPNSRHWDFVTQLLAYNNGSSRW